MTHNSCTMSILDNLLGKEVWPDVCVYLYDHIYTKKKRYR